MNARDELFQLILGRTTTKAVERILAAGYTKPRTITTAEELDALLVDNDRGVTLLDSGGFVWWSEYTSACGNLLTGCAGPKRPGETGVAIEFWGNAMRPADAIAYGPFTLIHDTYRGATA